MDDFRPYDSLSPLNQTLENTHNQGPLQSLAPNKIFSSPTSPLNKAYDTSKFETFSNFNINQNYMNKNAKNRYGTNLQSVKHAPNVQ